MELGLELVRGARSHREVRVRVRVRVVVRVRVRVRVRVSHAPVLVGEGRHRPKVVDGDVARVPRTG